MENRVLRYFLAIAREESITAAANYLHVSQPTLSRQIKDLEHELGYKLLNRTNHNVSLTAEGHLLRRRAEEIIALVDKTEEEFRTLEHAVQGDVYIGGGETRAMSYVAAACRELRREYPGIHYHLYSGNAEDVTERLDKGLLDFGILIQPTDISRYNFLRIPSEDTWGVIMRRDSPLAEKREIQRSDLLDVPLICSRQAIQQMEKNEFAGWFGEDMKKLNVVATFNLAYNAAIMAEQDVGYVITLDKLVDTSERSNLCFRPLAPKLASGMDLVWKKNQTFSKPAEALLEILQNRLADESCQQMKNRKTDRR